MPSNSASKLGTRVLMGIPTLKSSRRSIQWIEAMAGLSMPLGSSMGRCWIEDETIAEARNAICKKALEVDVDYLFMLGDDVLPPANTLLSMLDRIGRTYPVDGGEARASMISGVYWTKSYPPEPYLFDSLLKGTYKDWHAGEFFPIDMAGCDCLLIESSVLKSIPFPWFSTDWVWGVDQKPSSIATEDFYFYSKTRAAGYRLFADTSIQCWHEERSNGAMFYLTMDMVQAGGVPEVGIDEVLVADLGCGLSTLPSLFGPKATITRFDMREDVNPDVRCDIKTIPEKYFGLYDFVNASHVLEHFRRAEAPELLAHWVKLLKVGGTLSIHVPNFADAVKYIIAPPDDATPEQKKYAWAQIYGDQAQPGAPWQHLNGFTARKLESLLRTVPELTDIVVEEEDGGLNLKATAKLGRVQEPEALISIWGEIEAGRRLDERLLIKG